MIASVLLLLCVLPLALASGQGSYPMTYKSGINVNILGTAGTDYAVENFYHDPTIADFKVVFIKAATLIEMEHNANNIKGDGAAATLLEGQITIRPDGDRRTNSTPFDWIAYSAPFAFSSLNYGTFGNPEVPVVGTTGDNGVLQQRSTKQTHYYRGMLDSVGDEWHTLTVADDDRNFGLASEWQASDGKVHLFVVNPKTPCLSWAVTGTGQFYTTPAKTYFIPKIYDQTTYFAAGSSGTVSVTIRDINGGNVFYRIVSDTADAVTPYTDAAASFVTLADSAFAVGTHYLQYYYAGNAAFTKTRTVVKNPAYPSAGETHGDRLWLGSANFDTHIKESLKADWWMGQWRTQELRHQQAATEANINTGKRNLPSSAIINALVARCYGMNEKRSSTAPRSFAEYAKLSLLEALTNLDPVGVEIPENNSPRGTKELLYRGYYDVSPIFSYAGAYDIIAGYFRANQGYATGMTAIEDFFIRDSLARWVHMCGLQIGGYSGAATSADLNDTPSFAPGMWTTARFTGAAMIACMMPEYSTPYYGTSGMDDTPPEYGSSFFFPSLSNTWFKVFVDDGVTPTGYPNGQQEPAGYSIQFTTEGDWHDRIGYSNTALMGMPLGLYYNMLKMYHPTKTIPSMDSAMVLAAQGLLEGLKFNKISSTNYPGDPDADPPILPAGDYAPKFRAWAHMQNLWHPAFRTAAQPTMLALASTNAESIGQQKNARPFVVLWYNRELPVGQSVAAPRPPSGLRLQE